MRAIRRFIAVVAGFWLYSFAAVFVGGIFSAVSVSRDYFAYFGHGHQELALAILSVVGWALPVALLVAGGYLALHRLLPSRDSDFSKVVLAGMLISFGFWALVSVGYFSSPANEHASLWRAIQITFSFPWWSAPSFFAPWLGFGLAAWLLLRAPHPPSPSEA
jgi:hypothetical protein